jgi:hypothetical protein
LAKTTSLLLKYIRKIKKSINRVDFNGHAENAAETIKIRTRLGGGVSGGKRGGTRYALKSIGRTEKYNNFRKKTKKLNKTVTTPAKHNLTLTGQLLDSLYGQARGSKMFVKLKPDRDDGKKNDEIAKYQEDLGRYFFELTNKELKRLRSNIKQDLIKQIKR